MYTFIVKVLSTFAVLGGAIAQVTQTATPNASQYAKITSDLASYQSAITTESLYLAAVASVTDRATDVQDIGQILQTQSWSEGISALNSLIATTLPASVPTVVAELYKSVLVAEAAIINKDMAPATTTPHIPISTGANSTIIPSNNTTTPSTDSHVPTGPTGTTAAIPTVTGAASAQVMVNGLLLVAGLGLAAIL